MSQFIRERAHAPRMAHTLLLGTALILTLPQLSIAQEYSLFDKLSFEVGASQNFLNTSVRLDSKDFGVGTKIDFEDDVDLATNEFTPDLSVQWHLARRHELNFYWSDIDRTSTAQAAKEIHFGDLVVPLDGRVLVGFDITTYLAGYTYYPMIKDRLAVGVGGGLRVLAIKTALALQLLPDQLPPVVVAETGDVTSPLPFVSAEVRYGVSPHWRFTSNLGIFDATVGDVSGFQRILNAEIENLVGDHFSWGFSGNYSAVDVDAEDAHFKGSVQLDIGFIRFFVKGRL